MKKQFEMPVVNVDVFSTENIITASGITLNSVENTVLTALEEKTGVKVSSKYIISL